MREYRMSPWILLAVGAAWGIGLSAVAVVGLSLWMLSLGAQPPLSVLLYSVPASVGIALVLAWVISVSYPVVVSPEGIRAHDWLDRARFAPWATVESARPVNLGGLAYLRIDLVDGSPLWVPRFLVDQASFDAAILEYAPEANDVRRLVAASA